MRQYVLRRIALAVPTLILVSIIVFAMMRLMPGDVVTRMVEGHAYAPTMDALRKDLGLDRPVHVQYLEWIGNIALHGDFGRSYWTRQPIWDEFARRFPVTLELAALTIVVSVIIGIGVGIVSAVRQDSFADYTGRILSILALSVPYFGLAVVVVVVPSIYFKWTPVWTYVPLTVDPVANLKIMLVPALVFGITRAGPIMRIMRSALLDVLRQDYIRTAWSKGLGERTIVLRHALKNAMIPVISLIGLQMPLYIGGSVIIEAIFRLPGVGLFFFEALSKLDYPVVQSVNLIIAAMVVGLNLVIDLSYRPARRRCPRRNAHAALVSRRLGPDAPAQTARERGGLHRHRHAGRGRPRRRDHALRLRPDEPGRALHRDGPRSLAGDRSTGP